MLLADEVLQSCSLRSVDRFEALFFIIGVPLLFVPFGDNEYCLYILQELNTELAGRKLQSKFPWVDDKEFAENRKHFPQISKEQKKSIQQNFEYVWDHVQTELPGPSCVDA